MIFIVLPIHNEKGLIENAVKEIKRVMERLGKDYQIILAEDASTDGSKELCEELARKDDRIVHVHSDVKRGRGDALKRVAKMLPKDGIFIYLDVDLSTHPRNIERALKMIEKGYDIVVGSRWKKGAKVKRGIKRKFLSLLYNMYINFLFMTRILDHQCGFKVFNLRSTRDVIIESKSDGWFWDTETLVRAKWKGLKIYEMAVEWTESERKSKVSLVRDSKDMFLEALRLRLENVRFPKKVLACVFFVSLAVKLMLWPFFNWPYFEGISSSYLNVAKTYLKTGLLLEKACKPSGVCWLVPSFFRPPGYPLLLAFQILAFGEQNLRVLNLIFMALLSVILYFVALNLFSKRVALLAFVLELLNPLVWRMSHSLLALNYIPLFLLLALFFWLKERAEISGILMGTALYFREGTIVYFLPFFVHSIMEGKTKKFFTMFLFSFLICLPWCIRNFVAWNYFGMAAPKIGISMWEGVGEYDFSNRFGAPFTDRELLMSEGSVSWLWPDPVKRDLARIKKTINVIIQDPLWYLTVMIKRIPKLLLYAPGFGKIQEKLRFVIVSFRLDALLEVIPVILHSPFHLYSLIYYALLYLFSIFFLLRNPKRIESLLVIFFILLSIVHHVEVRYSFAAQYVFLLIASQVIAKKFETF